MSTQNYQARLNQIAENSHALRAVCIDTQFKGDAPIDDYKARMVAIGSAAESSPLFEGLGDGAQGVAQAWGSAISMYEQTYGEMPRDEVLASAATTLGRLSQVTAGSGEHNSAGRTGAFFESLMPGTLSNADSVSRRSRMAGLILPVMLQSTTGDAATYIPGGADESEIYRIYRKAGRSFGDVEAGTELDVGLSAQYSNMKQTRLPAEAAATNVVDFTLDIVAGTKNPAGAVVKRFSTKVYVDGRLVGADNQGDGTIYGKQFAYGGVNFTITGSATGKDIAVTINKVGAPAEGLPADTRVVLMYDVDIEQAPDIIPTINHTMDSWILRPHESVLAAEHTVQSYWAMQREYGIDVRSFQMSQQRNYLAYEKDMRNLSDMFMSANKYEEFNAKVTAGQYFKEHYELLNKKLLEISQYLLIATKVSGAVGIFAGAGAVALMKSLGQPHFKPVANYRQVPRIHYCGKLFDTWKLYEVPHGFTVAGKAFDKFTCLVYARGENHTEAGFVAGDAVPATMYNHGVIAGMKDRNTLWSLDYADIHPDNGGKYFVHLEIVFK